MRDSTDRSDLPVVQVVLTVVARQNRAHTIVGLCEAVNSMYQMGRSFIGPPFPPPPHAHKGCIVKSDEETGYGRLKAAEINHLMRMVTFVLDCVDGIEFTLSVQAMLRCAPQNTIKAVTRMSTPVRDK